MSAVQGDSPSLPDELREVDRLFADVTSGASFLQFLRVAAALSQHPNDVTGVRRSNYSDLIAEVSTRLQCGESISRAALDYLTTDVRDVSRIIHQRPPENAPDTTVRWRPLLRFPDRSYFYAPTSFGRRFQISYVKAALSGSWPFKLDASARPFEAYLW